MKRLSSSGFLEVHSSAPALDPNATQVKKPAILVHAGSFQSSDGAIEFGAARIQSVVDVNNAIRNKLIAEYGENTPVGAFPPILNQHKDGDNDDVVGRLTGAFHFERRDIPKVGKDVPCVVCEEITFLGKQNIEKVIDGRIYHLSVGINDGEEGGERDSLGEVSTVIEPAAPGAMLLSKKKLMAGDFKIYVEGMSSQRPIFVGDAPTLEEAKNLVQNEIAKYSATSIYVLNQGKKVFEMKGTKKLKGEAMSSKLKKLASLHKATKACLVKSKESSEKTRLAAAKAKVTHRLSGLMRGGKMTPAEFKKINIEDMVSMGDKALETMMGVFESREPVIMAGQRGTTNAVDFTRLAAGKTDGQIKRLKAEIAKDFNMGGAKLKRLSSFGGETTKEMEEGSEDLEKKMAEAAEQHGKELSVEDGEESKKMSKHMADLKKHLENGDIEAAKKCMAEIEKPVEKHLKRLAAGLEGINVGLDADEASPKAIAEMQEQIDMLQTNLAKLADEVEKIIKAEEAEVAAHAELEEGGEDEETELAAGEEPKDEKKALEADAEAKKLEGKEPADKKLGEEAGDKKPDAEQK